MHVASDLVSLTSRRGSSIRGPVHAHVHHVKIFENMESVAVVVL
jgi:hypothetical protein